MGVRLLQGLDAQATEGEILRAISEGDPLGLGKQVADTLDNMKGVENRLELFHPAYTTASRVILSRYDQVGSMSYEMAEGVSNRLGEEKYDSQLEAQDIPAHVLQEVFGALATIRGVVGELLRKGDNHIVTLFDGDNLHSDTPIKEAVTSYESARVIADRQQKNRLDSNDTYRVVSQTTPVLINRLLEVATVLDGVPFIRDTGRRVSAGNFTVN